jgi:DNA-binding beta-propeller fold protein YncE
MMACDRADNLFVVDEDNHTIRKIVVATGAVTTMVGIPHGTGVALGPLPARLNTPAGVAVGLEGELYITDLEENAVLVAQF